MLLYMGWATVTFWISLCLTLVMAVFLVASLELFVESVVAVVVFAVEQVPVLSRFQLCLPFCCVNVALLLALAVLALNLRRTFAVNHNSSFLALVW